MILPRMIPGFLALLFVACLASAQDPSAAVPPPADDVDTLPAQTAALAWLARVDAGSYGLSWDEGAAAFREKVTRDEWEKALAAVRGQLGEVRARKLRQMNYTRALPNAPPGEYVVIQYDTQFGERPSLETVTPMRDKDGTWRVSGYFIR